MRKRRRRFLTRAPTAERHRRCASSEGFLGGRSKSSRRLFSNQSIPPLPPTGATSSPRPGAREEMDGGFEFERWKGGTSEGSLEYKKEQPTPGEAWSADIDALTFWLWARRAGRSPSARGCCLRGESASVRRRRAQGPAGRNCFGTPVRLMGCPGATKAMDSTLGHHRKTSYY